MKEEITGYLQTLKATIRSRFEAFEPRAAFEKRPWEHHSGGGGEMGVLRGEVFEKAAVNFSAVEGTKLPFESKPNAFFATGLSLITHMQSPYMPTVHMNVRYIETETSRWFGGGYDLTPMGFANEEDTAHFHSIAKKHLDAIDPKLYPDFRKQAKEYFFIPHRNKERGVGGIFFDHYATGDIASDFALMRAVGDSFLEAIVPIYERRKDTSYTEEEKKRQLEFRAHYVEFNLLYDRGTRFGFQSGGNPDAILCSMPPMASW